MTASRFAAAQAPRPESVGLRPDAPAYARHGPYWVGTQDLVLDFLAEKASLPATVWYPAVNPSGRKAFCTYLSDTRHKIAEMEGFVATLAGHASRDAAADPSGQPYPLVVFSPAYGCSRVMSAPLLEHLASHGFVVLGVDHVPDAFSRRPKDVEHAIDFAVQPGALPVPVDAQRIALVGHGVGAKTVMNLGGVSFSRNQTDPYDTRVKAVVSIAMIETTIFMDPGHARSPMLFLTGSEDKYRPVADMEEIYRAMPAEQTALAVIAKAGNDTFLDPSLKALKPHWNWGSQDSSRAHDLANHFTTAFLLDVLNGDQEAHRLLLPEAVRIEEVQYTTTRK